MWGEGELIRDKTVPKKMRKRRREDVRGSRNNLTHCHISPNKLTMVYTAKPEILTVLLDDPEMGIRYGRCDKSYTPTASNETFKNLDPFWGPPFMSSHGGAKKKIDGYLMSLVEYL
jgi:hypothetical protein